MIVSPDLGRVAAGDQVRKLAAAEAAVKTRGPRKQDANGLLRLAIDRQGIGRLAVVAPPAAVGQGLGIAEIVHDRLLPAASSIGIPAHQVELVPPMPLPLVLPVDRHRLDRLPVEELMDGDIARDYARGGTSPRVRPGRPARPPGSTPRRSPASGHGSHGARPAGPHPYQTRWWRR